MVIWLNIIIIFNFFHSFSFLVIVKTKPPKKIKGGWKFVTTKE